jgi:hypothetical protein
MIGNAPEPSATRHSGGVTRGLSASPGAVSELLIHDTDFGGRTRLD